jgi:hypothetical protein
MKEEVILRILAQESPKSELRLRRCGEKNFRELFVISGKWLGVFLEIFLNSRVPVGISVDHGLIYFSIGNVTVDRVHGTWTGRRGSGPPWTEAAQTRGCSGALSVRGVRALGLGGAHRRRRRRTSRMRRCQRGAHWSMSGGEEAARRRQRTAAA